MSFLKVVDQGEVVLESIDDDDEEEESLFSIDFEEDRVYVGIGKTESCMNALLWTLKHAVLPSSTVVYLVHIFPVIRFVPSPLGGMLPKSKASPKVVENYEAQEKDERKKLLRKYIDVCSAAKVKVEPLLVESDMPAKAILDLIPTFNIEKLSKRNGIASKIIQNAPDSCDVKIITSGMQVIDQFVGSPTSRGSSTTSSSTRDEELVTSPLRGSPVLSVFKWVRIKPGLTFRST
ncbi:hypothetical protein UlMin_040859 [Ulmus minor]